MSDDQWSGEERRYIPPPERSYSLKDIVGTIIAITTAMIALTGAYYGLQSSVQKHELEAEIYRDLSKSEIKEIKENILLLKIEIQKVSSLNNEKISEIKEQLLQLDNSLTQIYQRIAAKK